MGGGCGRRFCRSVGVRADRAYRCEPVWRAETTLGLRFVRLSDL